jgi:lipopolysaccharide transport system ATP-binding protein
MPTDIAVSVRNLSKAYTIAHDQEKHITLAETILSRLKNPLRRPRTETFWALNDVSFDIKKGDVVGIIGRNGAGKSTLLKILSRITEPTAGHVELFGRVGSLLEVGTGFHPELTGRENVFLNGAILGMSKAEIRSQFDAIVDFAGVEKFLDTPVKRYSSGMYVRLAFAVAAHLNSEILIIDEVLAVGDAEFQKRCLGKMRDLSSGGRTVLFVSHNVAAIRSLCSHAIMLKAGAVIEAGKVEDVVERYLGGGDVGSDTTHVRWQPGIGMQSDGISMEEAFIRDKDGSIPHQVSSSESFQLVIRYELSRAVRGLRIGFSLKTTDGTLLCGSNDPLAWHEPDRGPGRFETVLDFPGWILNEGFYLIDIAADHAPYDKQVITATDCLRLTVLDVVGHGTSHDRLPGLIRPALKWTVSQRP